MRTILLLSVILAPVIGLSQSICNSVIANNGSYYSNGQISVCCTLGEPLVSTYSSSGTILTQGFQQNHKFIPVSIPNYLNASSDFIIYPNPAKDFLFIKLADYQASILANSLVSVSIYSMKENELIKSIQPFFVPVLKLDVTGLAPAPYILIITTDNHKESFVFTKI
jgi:hypothetical protein